MFITTSDTKDQYLIEYAQSLSQMYNIPYIHRNKKSLKYLSTHYQSDIIVVKPNTVGGYTKTHYYFEFHPNLSKVRAKRILNNDDDALIQASGLQYGDTFLDCTMGLASDSFIASLVVGEFGKVVALEANLMIHIVVTIGLKMYTNDNVQMDGAMRRIHTKHKDYGSYLKQAPNNAYDVIYFDPMFELNLNDSKGIDPLKQIANYSRLNYDVIDEAKRVARRKVIIKAEYNSPYFEMFHCTVNRSSSRKFQYGVIDI